MVWLLLVMLTGATLTAQWSVAKEAALGAGLVVEIRRELAAIDDPVAVAYLEAIAGRFEGNWKISITRNGRGDSLNEPIWLPGGYILVPAPLILAAKDEAELAGMLAHAMAHIAQRHGIREGRTPISFFFFGDARIMPRAWQEQEREAGMIAAGLVAGADFESGPPSAEFLEMQERVRVNTAVRRKVPSLRRPGER